MDRGRAQSLALINDVMVVLNHRCDNVCPLVLLIFIREMPKQTETEGRLVLALIRHITGIVWGAVG